MATSRITLRTIDYHKYRSLVIERNGDDELYGRCDRDVAALCDAVRRLYDRYERFQDDDDGGDDYICGGGSGTSRDGRDLTRFAEICGWYKLILENRRVSSVDVRLRSCWWQGRNGGERAALTTAAAGRLRSSSLRQTLVDKTVDWLRRYGPECWRDLPATESEVSRRLDGPGVAVFAHRDRPCFRLVARAASVFSWCSGALRDAFEGSNPDPLSALFVTSVSQHWDFYFIPVLPTDIESLLRVLENDTILQHDSVWPYGLNFRLHVTSFPELAQLRTSCRRHRWPTARDFDLDSDDVSQVQGRLCRRLLYGLNGTLDDVLTGHKEFDIVQSLSDSPTSESTAMLTFADVVAASTVKTWNECKNCGCRSDRFDAGSDSSDGSTVTATTVRTVVNRPPSDRDPAEDRTLTKSSGSSSTSTNGKLTASAPHHHRSASRPGSSRVRQLATPRSRSVSQSRPLRNASGPVPAAETRSVKTRPSHISRPSQKR